MSIVTTFSVNGISCPLAKYKALATLSVSKPVLSRVLYFSSPRPTLTALLVTFLNDLVKFAV